MEYLNGGTLLQLIKKVDTVVLCIGRSQGQEIKVENIERYHIWSQLPEGEKDCASRHQDGKYFGQDQTRSDQRVRHL